MIRLTRCRRRSASKAKRRTKRIVGRICSRKKRYPGVKARGAYRCASAIKFEEQLFPRVAVSNLFLPLPSQNTSLSQSNMYMIKNRSGDATVEANIEISPDDADYYMDTAGIVIKPQQNYVVIPLRFAKFTRVSLRTAEEGKTAVADVVYQTQNQLTAARCGCKRRRTGKRTSRRSSGTKRKAHGC